MGDRYHFHRSFHVLNSRFDDIDWVTTNLCMNKWLTGSVRFDLESNYGFQLLDPNRDFELGYDEATQIEEGLQKSRRFIFILSRLSLP